VDCKKLNPLPASPLKKGGGAKSNPLQTSPFKKVGGEKLAQFIYGVKFNPSPLFKGEAGRGLLYY
jgi:hypothetical protein